MSTRRFEKIPKLSHFSQILHLGNPLAEASVYEQIHNSLTKVCLTGQLVDVCMYSYKCEGMCEPELWCPRPGASRLSGEAEGVTCGLEPVAPCGDPVARVANAARRKRTALDVTDTTLLAYRPLFSRS